MGTLLELTEISLWSSWNLTHIGKHSDHYFRRCNENIMTTIFMLYEKQYDIGRRGGAENACVKVICIDGFVLLAQL